MKLKKFENFNEMDPYGEETWGEQSDILDIIRRMGDEDDNASGVWETKITISGSIWNIFGDSIYWIVSDKGIYKFIITDDECIPEYVGENTNEAWGNIWSEADQLYQNFGRRLNSYTNPNFKDIFEGFFKKMGIEMNISGVYRKKYIFEE